MDQLDVLLAQQPATGASESSQPFDNITSANGQGAKVSLISEPETIIFATPSAYLKDANTHAMQ